MAITSFRGQYYFLSNFYPCNILMPDGITYPTAEHAFQAAKTSNLEDRKKIASNSSPVTAKHLGRTVALRPDWEQVKVNVMQEILRAKFSQEPLKTLLLNTGNEELVEVNTWHDNFWGACNCIRCQNKLKENTLGYLLMMLREELNSKSHIIF